MFARLHIGPSLVALSLACNPGPGVDGSGTSSGTSSDSSSGATGDAVGCQSAVPTGSDDAEIECPPGNLVYYEETEEWVNSLYNQDEIDQFAGCTHAAYSLSIGGGDILDLTPLASLRHIAGTLSLHGTGNFPRERGGPTSLAGLEGLRSIQGLRLTRLPLADLCPLAGITEIPGEVWLTQLPSLTSLEGLHNLASIGEALVVDDLAKLQDLSGLRGLQRVGVRVWFGSLPLTSLHGLEALTEVGMPGGESRIGLYQLDQLTSLEGLALDWRPEHELWIYHSAISDLNFLAGVDELTALDLDGNALLTTLTGLESLAVVRGELRLGDNPNIIDLAALASLKTLGALTLETSAITDLGPLPALEMPGDLRIVGNEQLTSLSILAGATTLRSLVLESNPMLAGLPELTALAQVEGDFELRRSAGLTDLSDLAAVTSVGGRLAVVDNPELLQTDAEAWAAPIVVGGARKIFDNKGDSQPPIDPCPWANDGQCDHVCVDDGWDCASD